MGFANELVTLTGGGPPCGEAPIFSPGYGFIRSPQATAAYSPLDPLACPNWVGLFGRSKVLPGKVWGFLPQHPGEAMGLWPMSHSIVIVMYVVIISFLAYRILEPEFPSSLQGSKLLRRLGFCIPHHFNSMVKNYEPPRSPQIALIDVLFRHDD